MDRRVAESLKQNQYGGELPEEVLPTIALLEKYGLDTKKINYITPGIIPQYPSNTVSYLLGYYEDGYWFKVIQYFPNNLHGLFNAKLVKWAPSPTISNRLDMSYLQQGDDGFLQGFEEILLEAKALFDASNAPKEMFERFFVLRYGMPIGTDATDSFATISKYPPSKLFNLLNPTISLQNYVRLTRHKNLPLEEYETWHTAPDDWIKEAWKK